MLFICYPNCSTCKKAKKFLEEGKFEFKERDIKLERPSVDEITEWIRTSGLSVKKFFNTSGLAYKNLGLKDKLGDMSEEEQIKLLAADGMLVKRPILIGNGLILVGFKLEEWMEKLKK